MTNPRGTSILFFSLIFALILSSMAFGQEDPRETLKNYDPGIEKGKPDQTTELPPKPLPPPPTSAPDSTTPIEVATSSERSTPSEGSTASHGTNPSTTPASSAMPIASAPVPSSNARGGLALLGWLQQAGLTGETLRTAWAIGMRESRGDPRAHNDNPRTRDDSYGLFQINMRGRLGPARMRQFGISSYAELLDPAVNCRAMFILSRQGTDFGPWGLGPHAYRRSAQLEANFRRFYNQFPPTR